MKKNSYPLLVFITLIVSVVASISSKDVYASRARELVIGTGDAAGAIRGGSFVEEGAYNIFYNPAYVNEYKNWAIIEKGVAGQVPAAQGGFVSKFGNFNLGFYFNRDEAISFSNKYTNGSDMRPIEVILGMDTGVKWGLSVTYGSFSANRTDAASEFGLKVGAQFGDIEPYIHLLLISSDKIGGLDNRGSGIGAGLRYKMGEWAPFVAFRTGQWKVGAAVDQDITNYDIGISRSTKLSEGVKMNYSLSYARINEANRIMVPIYFALEGDVTSWLALRTGLTYHLMDQVNSASIADNGTARLGATIHVGKADFDWVVGTAGNAEAIDGRGFGFDNGFFTASSLTYHW